MRVARIIENKVIRVRTRAVTLVEIVRDIKFIRVMGQVY
jgi:hypothetical protein